MGIVDVAAAPVIIEVVVSDVGPVWQSSTGTLAFPKSCVTAVPEVLHVQTAFLSPIIVLDVIDVPVIVGGVGMPGAASASSAIPVVPFELTGVLGVAYVGGLKPLLLIRLFSMIEFEIIEPGVLA